MSVKVVAMLHCDKCGAGLAAAGGYILTDALELTAPMTLREEAARHGWKRTGNPSCDVCRFCYADERAAKRAEAKARKAEREAKQ